MTQSQTNTDSRRIPLLRDRHSHPLLYAALMDGVNLSDDSSETRDQAIGRIRSAASGHSRWTIAYGWNSGRYPLAKHEFDDLPPLVILDLSLHGLIVNNAGRDLLRRTDPLVCDNLDNQEWLERNLMRVLNLFAIQGVSADRLQRFYDWLLQEHGVFHAEEMLLVDAMEIQLFEQTGLSERTRFWAAPHLYQSLPEPLRAKVHGIKLFTDGAIGPWSAAFRQPFQGTANRGTLIYQDAELQSLLSRYLDQGKPMAVHAIGNRAIDQVVGTLEAIGGSRGTEVRMEHAQFISEATANRAKSLGLHLCMQPNFSDDSLCYADRLPAGYARQNNPFRMLIDRVGYVPGQDLYFGSDGMPHGAREAFRQSLFPPHAEQALTVDEVIDGYCAPDTGTGHLDLQIDWNKKQITIAVTARNRMAHSSRTG